MMNKYGKNSFGWTVRDTGKCKISHYQITTRKGKEDTTEQSVTTANIFILPSKDITHIKIKVIFKDSKAFDDSNHWYDVRNPVGPVPTEGMFI